MEKKEKLYPLHTLICLLLLFGAGHLPPVEPLTPLGMKLAAIFFGLLYGWIFIGNIWPSLAGLLALMLVVGIKPASLLQSSFGDPIVVMMFFIFIFCAAVNYYRLSHFISLWFIRRPFVQGRPWLFTLLFLASIALLGGLTSASPAVLIGWNLLEGVCQICGYQRSERYPAMMTLGVVFAAQTGMSMLPFKQLPLTAISAFETMSGASMNYAGYMLLAVLCCSSCLLVFLAVAKYLFRPEMEKLQRLDPAQVGAGETMGLNAEQKIVFCALLALVCCLLLPNFLPADYVLTIFLRKLGNTGICILLVMLLCAVRIADKPLLPFDQLAKSGVSWGIILLLAVVQPLSAAMSSEESGVTAMLLKLLSPVLSGSSTLFFLLMLGLVAVALANVMNIGAVGVALMPVVCSYCAARQLDPQLPVAIVVLCIHLGLLLPSASTCAALLHGNDGYSGAVRRMAPAVVALAWLATMIIAINLGPMIFG